ncbi:MAG: hypothetical protein DRI65_15365, partial [Chloroflexota bacterium]
MTEAARDLWELSVEVRPKSYQNKDIEGMDDYITKEIQNYMYSLVDMPDPENLFLFEDTRAWADEEFMERIMIGARFKNPGDAWKIRPETWAEFLVLGKFDYTYNERINYERNLDKIGRELVRNPDTRQAWLPIFHPKDVNWLGGERRIPCSLGYHFMLREGVLNLTYIQRSADLVKHFGNDVYLAWSMLDYVAHQVGVKRGMLTHVIFSLHSYKRDWPKLQDG